MRIISPVKVTCLDLLSAAWQRQCNYLEQDQEIRGAAKSTSQCEKSQHTTISGPQSHILLAVRHGQARSRSEYAQFMSPLLYFFLSFWFSCFLSFFLSICLQPSPGTGTRRHTESRKEERRTRPKRRLFEKAIVFLHREAQFDFGQDKTLMSLSSLLSLCREINYTVLEYSVRSHSLRHQPAEIMAPAMPYARQLKGESELAPPLLRSVVQGAALCMYILVHMRYLT